MRQSLTQPQPQLQCRRHFIIPSQQHTRFVICYFHNLESLPLSEKPPFSLSLIVKWPSGGPGTQCSKLAAFFLQPRTSMELLRRRQSAFLYVDGLQSKCLSSSEARGSSNQFIKSWQCLKAGYQSHRGIKQSFCKYTNLIRKFSILWRPELYLIHQNITSTSRIFNILGPLPNGDQSWRKKGKVRSG